MRTAAESIHRHLMAVPKGELVRRADLAGVSRSLLSAWRRSPDMINPTLEKLFAIAEITAAPLPQLLGLPADRDARVDFDAALDFERLEAEIRETIERHRPSPRGAD